MARKYGASGKGGKKRSAESLKADNAGVKDGTIRKGKGGKTVRRYNAKTGRWDILRVIDKKGRTKVTKKVTETPDSPPTRPTIARVSPSARGEGSLGKPNKTKTYNPGAGATRPKTPGDKFFDSARRAIEVRGGNAAKTRGRDAIVKANNKKIADERRAARKRREEALKAAVEARAKRMRGYR